MRAIDWSTPCGSRHFRPDGARRLRRYCRAKRVAMRGSCRKRLRIRLHQDFGRLRVTAIDQESADVLSLTMQSPNGQPLPTAMPGQYVVVRLQPAAGGPPLFRSYSLSGPALDGALSNQREDRTEWGGRNLPAGACAGGRCSRRQLAARKLHSAVRRAAGGAAQRGNRGDAGSGDAVRAGGGALDTAGLVAARSSRSGASSLRR